MDELQTLRVGDPNTRAAASAAFEEPRVAEPEAEEARHGDNLRKTGGHVARIAHELNKSTSLVVGSLENLEGYVRLLVDAIEGGACDQSRDGDGRLDYAIENAPAVLDICRQGASRLTRVVDQLKAFTRPSGEAKAALDLAEVLETAASWAQQHRPGSTSVSLDLGALPPIRADFELLTESFVNLISNALDAVSARRDGRVEVTAVCVKGNERADFVEVRVRDNGPGVSAEARARIFDPFFTTKSSSEGLGLGLAIARDTVESSGGTLEVAEPQGEGAEFIARWPAL